MLFFLRNNSTHDNMFKYGESLDEDRCRICKEQIKEKENNFDNQCKYFKHILIFHMPRSLFF